MINTVADLIVQLQKQDPNAILRVTWEGQFVTLSPDNIYVHLDGRVLIDADYNEYKREFMGTDNE